MHKAGFAHLNFTPSAIWLDHDMNVTLSDLGSSRNISDKCIIPYDSFDTSSRYALPMEQGQQRSPMARDLWAVIIGLIFTVSGLIWEEIKDVEVANKLKIQFSSMVVYLLLLIELFCF